MKTIKQMENNTWRILRWVPARESLGSQGREEAVLSRLTPPPPPPNQGLSDFMLMTTRNYRGNNKILALKPWNYPTELWEQVCGRKENKSPTIKVHKSWGKKSMNSNDPRVSLWEGGRGTERKGGRRGRHRRASAGTLTDHDTVTSTWEGKYQW